MNGLKWGIRCLEIVFQNLSCITHVSRMCRGILLVFDLYAQWPLELACDIHACTCAPLAEIQEAQTGSVASSVAGTGTTPVPDAVGM